MPVTNRSTMRESGSALATAVCNPDGTNIGAGGAGSGGPVTSPLGAGTAAAAVRTTLASDDPAVASLSVLDDWDETDRAKVNIIVGQAGVAAGSGVNGATVQRVTIATDDTLVAALAAPGGYSAAVTLTRTNDTNAYTANDVVGAATGSTAALTFASMGASGKEIMITSVALEIDAAAVISGETSYRLYLYNITPPSALGDNAAWDLPSGDRASFLGYVDLGTPVDLGSTLYVEINGVNKQVKLAGTSLFGYLVTNGAYTPTASRVHVITLHSMDL